MSPYPAYAASVVNFALVLCASLANAGSLDAPDQPAGTPIEVSDWTPYNCRLAPSEGGVALVDITSQPVIQCEIAIEKGAACVEFEMRCDLPEGDHYVSWSLAGIGGWKDFVRIPVVVDGAWHRYRLPLSPSGETVALRLAFTTEAGATIVVRSVRVSNIAPSDDVAIGELATKSEPLQIRFDLSSRRFQVVDSRTGRSWTSEPLSDWVTVENGFVSPEGTLDLGLRCRFTQEPVTMRLTPGIDASFGITITPQNPDMAMDALLGLTPRFTCDMSQGRVVFCDRSCGVLLDHRDVAYASWPLRVYGNTHCLDMPWVGVYDTTSGDGILTLFDTPADAEVAFETDAEGRHWAQPRWLPSRDRFGYERRVSYHLINGGGYVGMAKRYRQILRDSGRLKTLHEKAIERPAVNRLPGSAIVWSMDRHTDQLEEAQALGVRRAVVSNVNKPARVAALKSEGFLAGRYDSYTDIFQGAVGFQRDDIATSAVRGRPGASPLNGWRMDDGRQMAWRSSALWRHAAETYVPKQLAHTGHNARFIDVAVAAKPNEDWSLKNGYDRRQDLKLRRELLKYIAGFGLAIGTEHGNDWAADLVDYHEGSLSGPFWWSSWEAGRLRPPRRDQLTDDYLKYGMGYANRIPLWQLVYQDCLVSTWYWGDTAGMLYRAAPELTDRKDLFTLLYGGTPLLWLDQADRGYGWRDNRWRWLQTYHDTTELHRRVAFSELLTHEVLSDNATLQRTRFSDGSNVLVNFGDEPAADPDDPATVLAPHGYRVLANGLRQERLWSEAGAVVELESDTLLVLDSPTPRTKLGVTHRGRVTLWPDGDRGWRAMGEPDAEATINLTEVTGWSAEARCEVRPIVVGDLNAAPTDHAVSKPLRLAASKDGWAVAIRLLNRSEALE